MKEKDFTAMVCSKILHDLAGPIGAVMNGAELIEDSQPQGLEEIIDLLKSSSNQLTALLQVFRIGFGALSTGGNEVDATMVQKHLEDYTLFKGVQLTWQPEDPLIDKDIAKIIVNAVLLFTELARKKGQLQVSCSNGGGVNNFSVAAFGQGITAPEDLKAILGGAQGVETTTGNIPAFMITGLVKARGFQVNLAETPNGIVLQGQAKA